MVRYRIVACAGVAAAALAFGGPAHADAMEALLEAELPVLQRIYLQCVAESEQRALSFGEAASCSQVYEAVKRRMFDGSFDRMLAWTREQQIARERPESTPR